MHGDRYCDHNSCHCWMFLCAWRSSYPLTLSAYLYFVQSLVRPLQNNLINEHNTSVGCQLQNSWNDHHLSNGGSFSSVQIRKWNTNHNAKCLHQNVITAQYQKLDIHHSFPLPVPPKSHGLPVHLAALVSGFQEIQRENRGRDE